MPTFELNTEFSDEDLGRLYITGTNIVVAKPTPGGGTPNVAWIVYRPMAKNKMTWEEQYGIYASNTDVVNGATLVQFSKTLFPAVDGKLYTVKPDSTFSLPGGGAEKNSYTAVNEYDNRPKGYLTIGLYQNANVNGEQADGNAVSAAPMLYKSTAVMTPYTTVYLWTQSLITSNTVVTKITSRMTIATFGGSVTSLSLRYDSSEGKFVPAGSTMEHPRLIEHVMPQLF